MTDGINQFFARDAPPGESDYTALGFYSDNPGVDIDNDQDFLDGRQQQLCSEMKGLGIEIFTIGFDLERFREGNPGSADAGALCEQPPAISMTRIPLRSRAPSTRLPASSARVSSA